MTPGVYFFDLHRLEHLAIFAYRLPRPKRGEVLRQTVSLFLVRQGQVETVSFKIWPEPPPAPEREGEPVAAEWPPVYLASAAAPSFNATLLLDENGRLLQAGMRYGEELVVATLDDPLTRAREKRLRRQREQEGPRLLRPPWF